MKSLASLSTTAKVGGASVLGGGGIVGTGLFIHHQMKFKLTGLDKDLTDEEQAYLEVNGSSTTDFTFSNNEATIKIRANSSKAESQFKTEDRWICTIKATVTKTPSVTLSSTNLVSGEFGKIKDKLGSEESKRNNKNNLIKSCAKNRTEEQKRDKTKAVSEIRVELQSGSGSNASKYEFPESFIKELFEGNWENPKTTVSNSPGK